MPTPSLFAGGLACCSRCAILPNVGRKTLGEFLLPGIRRRRRVIVIARRSSRSAVNYRRLRRQSQNKGTNYHSPHGYFV